MVVAVLAAVVPGQPPRPQAPSRALAAALDRALAVPHVSLAASAAFALDLDTGETVYSRNASLPLLPASNEKLAVTYAALTALGPSFTIETDVLGDGQQVDTTWQGNLVLKGYGDPTLSSADLTVLARQVRAAGITRVTGRIVGDESWFDARRTAPGWKAAFYIDESPPLSALIVDRGRRRTLHVARSCTRGSSAVPFRARPRRRRRRRRHDARRRRRHGGADRSSRLAAARTRSCAGWTT